MSDASENRKKYTLLYKMMMTYIVILIEVVLVGIAKWH